MLLPFFCFLSKFFFSLLILSRLLCLKLRSLSFSVCAALFTSQMAFSSLSSSLSSSALCGYYYYNNNNQNGTTAERRRERRRFNAKSVCEKRGGCARPTRARTRCQNDDDDEEGCYYYFSDRTLLEMSASFSTKKLAKLANEKREKYFGNVVTFSPKVFVPLTFACRDKCGYCTFVKEPEEEEEDKEEEKKRKNIFMTEEEVLSVAREGKKNGATECLFTLGDRPEAKYPAAKRELEEKLGCASTVEYVAKCAKRVLEETGLLPHVNCGVLTVEELKLLKKVSASQGLMVETTSERLMEPGMAHFECESKRPSVRLNTLRNAGKAKVPFTTGILVGIGETAEERVKSLLEIRKLAEEEDGGDCIGEIIVQNFRAKEDTRMKDDRESTLDELVRAVALARLCFDEKVTIQVPPNLTPGEEVEDGWRALLNAGINDWGGISPGVTPDFVSPECEWPALKTLSAVCREEGRSLVPRLAAHPRFIGEKMNAWIDEEVAPHVRVLSDAGGFGRGMHWSPGSEERASGMSSDDGDGISVTNLVSVNGAVEPGSSSRNSRDNNKSNNNDRISSSRNKINRAIEKCMATKATVEDVALLFETRGDDFDFVCSKADALRQEQCGDIVSYVINRNINYTNVCEFTCHFCAFSKGKFGEEATRDKPYCLDSEEIARRTKEAWDKGATEVCMQGGIHPDFTGESYLDFLKAAKTGAPNMHVHAFSPLEIHHGATSLNVPIKDYLKMLKDAGLGSLPGTAAEVLDDAVRQEICPDKLNSEEWLSVVKSAHQVGIKTTSTIMFGHVDSETHVSWSKHLLALRELHRETNGITEFVPLPFVHFKAPIYEKGRARKGPTMRECVLMHAIGRLVLGPIGIKNIQASWPKMGPSFASNLLFAGCNDVGGVLMNESITRAAGSTFGQEFNVVEMEALITRAGRVPRLRNTLYENANEERRMVGIENAHKSVVVNFAGGGKQQVEE